MDPAKYRKLEEYSSYLARTGEKFEKEGEKILAIREYLKLVDVLLLMADAAPNYPAWLQLSDRASAYQKKVKGLIAAASLETETTGPNEAKVSPVAPSSPIKSK